MKTIHTLCLFILTISIYLLLSPSQCSIDSFQNIQREHFAMNKRSKKKSTKKKSTKKKSTKKKPSKKKSTKKRSKSSKNKLKRK